MQFKLANILLENNDRFYSYRNLYCFSASPISENLDLGCKTLFPYNIYDFGTYFNSFSLVKWREYTNIKDIYVHLEISGKCEVVFEGIKKLPVGIDRHRLNSTEVDSADFTKITFQYPQNMDDLLSFKIITHSYCQIKDCYYYTDIDESHLNHVDLVLATTTYKKEAFIRKNVDLFTEEIVGSINPDYGSIQMILVDNGETLLNEDFNHPNVHLFHNSNVGGSGGFARGMIEAKRLSKPATHVLIMDDDIELSPESIKRTHCLLALVKDEYKDAFLSGAMFSLGNQSIQVEDIGHARASGSFGAIKKRKDMNIFYQVLTNETEKYYRKNKYAAFWYCCIPMKTIKEKGLPLPLFIRYDDAEYGLRCKPKFMSMNGICVWHEDFDMRYSAFYEKYCGVRNALIIQAVSAVVPNIDYFDKKVDKNFKRDIKKFNYDSAELVLDALEDYMKGPSFIEHNNCEKILKEKIKKNERLISLEDLDIDEVDLDEIRKSKKRGKLERAIDALTYNKQRFTIFGSNKSRQAKILFDANAYPGKRVKGATEIVMIHPHGKVGCKTRKDKQRFRSLHSRYKKLKNDYKRRHRDIEAQYASRRDYLYSEDFWIKYLDLNSESC